MSKSYEVHITIDPVLDEFVQMALTTVIEPHGFKLAELYKGDGELSEKDSFLTGHYWNIIEAQKALGECLKDLIDRNFRVRRAKIEKVLYDVRF